MPPLLSFEDLRVRYRVAHGTVDAVRGISLDVGAEKVGIVGESGSGKSTIGRAIMRLLPANAEITARRMRFRDIDLLAADRRRMQSVRGRHIGIVLQDPKYTLNPVRRIGDQIAENFRAHHRMSRGEARERSLAMLEAVKIRDPARVYDLYPHEVSGGMGQRIVIAMTLAPEPRLIIADEPTSALDVTVRMSVLAILDDLVSQRGIGLIFISHDLNLVGSFCDRVAIMYAGRIVETCPAAELRQARHAYTQGLLAALPSLAEPKARLATLQRDPAWLNEGQDAGSRG
jgi:peptide/nickel transport system ATP-binding protein